MSAVANRIGPVAVSDTVLLAGGAAAVVLVIGGAWYALRKLGQAKDKVVDTATAAADYVRNDAVDITSNKNIPATVVNAVGGALGLFGTNDYTGQDNTLGSGIEELHRRGQAIFGDWW